MNIFEVWKEVFQNHEFTDYVHAEPFSASGKTEKIVIPPKPGYDLLGYYMVIPGVVLTATAAENVVSGAESLMDLLKNMKHYIEGRKVVHIDNADVLERIIAYFTNEDVVVASGRKASQLANFADAGSATHYLGIPIPFVVLDGEGQSTIQWEFNAITDLFAADVSIAAHNIEISAVYGHWPANVPPPGIRSFKPSIPAAADKNLATEMKGETARAEIYTGIGADTYVDNITSKEGGLNTQGPQAIADTENRFLVTRDTGEFVVTHVPAQFTTYMVENGHSSAITPVVIVIYDRTLRQRTTPEVVAPQSPTPAPPTAQPETPVNSNLQVAKPTGLLGMINPASWKRNK